MNNALRLTAEELPLAITSEATFIVLKDGRYYLDFDNGEEDTPFNIFEALIDYFTNETHLSKVTLLSLTYTLSFAQIRQALEKRIDDNKLKHDDE